MNLYTRLLLTLFIVLAAATLQAQPYKAAVGARVGYPTALSYKKFLGDAHAVELYAGTYFNRLSLHAAYQIHHPIEAIENLSFYYGAGAAFIFWNTYRNNYSRTGVGVQLYGGLDYFIDIEGLPLNLSVDWVPSYFFGNTYVNGIGAGYGTLAIRYVLR
ncbi:MAG: hypothetical protein OHK0039_00570 [Bacteroidia bacterium]